MLQLQPARKSFHNLRFHQAAIICHVRGGAAIPKSGPSSSTSRKPGISSALPSVPLAQRSEAARISSEKSLAAPTPRSVRLCEPVVMDQFGIRLLCPALRGGIDLIGKDAHGSRDRDAFRGEKGKLAFPIQTSRRDRRVRQPVERDVVEDVVSRQALAACRRRRVPSAPDCVASWSSIQAARPIGESAIPYSVCGRFAISWA